MLLAEPTADSDILFGINSHKHPLQTLWIHFLAIRIFAHSGCSFSMAFRENRTDFPPTVGYPLNLLSGILSKHSS